MVAVFFLTFLSLSVVSWRTCEGYAFGQDFCHYLSKNWFEIFYVIMPKDPNPMDFTGTTLGGNRRKIVFLMEKLAERLCDICELKVPVKHSNTANKSSYVSRLYHFFLRLIHINHKPSSVISARSLLNRVSFRDIWVNRGVDDTDISMNISKQILSDTSRQDSTDTWRNYNVIITSKRRRDVVLTG